ncbi:MAG: aspartate 1-decarboxylase [Clostridiales bacterium]|nr:aspartate 1-decarboxylase [Clostridiales bacterium]
MNITILKSKIHRAVVTQANIDYVGSITIDEELMDAAGLYEYEMVYVMDINNGSRFQTYVIKGPRGKKDICLNGAAARLVHLGDKVIIMAFGQMDEKEIPEFTPKVVFVDEENSITDIKSYEKHGEIL